MCRQSASFPAKLFQGMFRTRYPLRESKSLCNVSIFELVPHCPPSRHEVPHLHISLPLARACSLGRAEGVPMPQAVRPQVRRGRRDLQQPVRSRLQRSGLFT